MLQTPVRSSDCSLPYGHDIFYLRLFGCCPKSLNFWRAHKILYLFIESERGIFFYFKNTAWMQHSFWTKKFFIKNFAYLGKVHWGERWNYFSASNEDKIKLCPNSVVWCHLYLNFQSCFFFFFAMSFRGEQRFQLGLTADKIFQTSCFKLLREMVDLLIECRRA